MMKLNEQGTDTGLNPESKKKPSSPELKTKRTEPIKISESTTNQSQLINGSQTSETPKQMTSELLESDQDSGSSTIRPKKQKSLMPVPKAASDKKRADQALKRLKVKVELLASAPPLTPLIKSTVKGGLKAALEAMRFSMDDAEIKAFLKVYDKVPVGDRDRLSWEAISIAAKVNPKHLIGAIQLAVQTHCWNRSRFIAVSNHPDVTKARVKYAKMAGGERDRTQLDIALGILQSPKGPTFIGKQVAVFGNGGGQKQEKKEDESKTVEAQFDSSDGFDDLFPSPNDVQEKLVPIRQRLLEG